MSDSGPFGPDDDRPDPFKGMPFFGDLARMVQSQLQGQGPVAWDAAQQLALSIVTEGRHEPNVDPTDRIALEELGRVAELQVAAATGLRTSTSGSGLRVTAVNRVQWVQETLRAYRPRFERLAGSLPKPDTEPGLPDPSLAGGDPTAFLQPLFQMMAPMLSGMMAGSMVGNLGRRALGPYTLPIPRSGDELGIVLPNLETFAGEWSLPADDLRLWVCLHEVAHHTVLTVPHVRGRLESLLDEYLGAFEASSAALEERLGDLDPTSLDPTQGPMALFGDPELLLGAIQSPRQRELRPHLDTVVALVLGVVDHIIESVGRPLLSSYGPLTEAFRRRRVAADPADRFVEHLFGLELDQATYDRGQAFVQGVLERAGADGLNPLWTTEAHLPTPAELDAPGLWLARLELPTDDS